MKLIDRNDILDLDAYEAQRARFRNEVIAAKKRRRVQVGPSVSALFENRDTVLLQIQEMLRAERITRPEAVQHEIDTYNQSIPGRGELSCTFMIEIPDPLERDAFLREARDFENHVWFFVDSERVKGGPAGGTGGAGSLTDRTTAVHYLKFELKGLADRLSGAAAAGRSATATIGLEIDLPGYRARAVLAPETLRELAGDLKQ